METLTAFVRERTSQAEAKRTSTPFEQRVERRAYFLWENAGQPEGRSEDFRAQAVEQEKLGEPPAADIDAVLTVIKRRSEESQKRERDDVNSWRLDFRGAVLRSADLFDAHLERANLAGAHFEAATLVGAYLRGADLSEAHLGGANLFGVHLEQAAIFEACLVGAHLGEAHLKGAYLERAHLERAYLERAHLEGADLIGGNCSPRYG
jgi:uncharacterized protein YjbI with pentapeptide repeats